MNTQQKNFFWLYRSRPIQKSLKHCFSPQLISKIFVLVAGSYLLLLFIAFNIAGKILLCVLDFLLHVRFLSGEQRIGRIIGLTVRDRNVKDLLLNAKGSFLLSIPACESQAHQLEKSCPKAKVMTQDFSSFLADGSEKPASIQSNNGYLTCNLCLTLVISENCSRRSGLHLQCLYVPMAVRD